MSDKNIPDEFQELIDSITNKRAKVVINHILKHGRITTEELEKDYGYSHPPRAARDVREAGVPLKTIRVKSSDGKRNIAAYQFGDFSSARYDRLKGRQSWPKNFKKKLIDKYGNKCLISGAALEARSLQIDHRVPYEIEGDINEKSKLNIDDYMLLSGSSNRAKSWSCEHCKNWLKIRDKSICETCYWAYPEDYTHIAMEEIRRVDITWQDKEVEDYDNLKKESDNAGEPLADYIKNIISKKEKE